MSKKLILLPALMLGAFLMFTPACGDSDACKDVDCGTNGTCFSGDCVCDDGYEIGASGKCDTESRVKFYGNYNVSETCGGPADTYSSGIEAGPSITEVKITNFGNSGLNVNGTIDGDKLTDDEILGFMFLMVIAGNETTTKLLGNAFYHLSRHPEQLRDVFADPENPQTMVAQWVEETLRYDTSSVLLARHLREDVTLHGVTAPAGSRVVLLIGSANRDADVFTEPESFNVHRAEDELSRILSFGGGRHYCLGANLARLEARVVLNEVVRRCSSIEVEEAACKRFYSSNVRGFAQVPTRFEVR